jgi:hypothetical protein
MLLSIVALVGGAVCIAAPAPTGVAEIVSDDFPILHATLYKSAKMLRIKKDLHRQQQRNRASPSAEE